METIEMAAAKIKCIKFDIFSGKYGPAHILDYQVLDDNRYRVSCNPSYTKKKFYCRLTLYM